MKNLTRKVIDLWRESELEDKVDFLRDVKSIDLSKGYSVTSKDKIDYYNYKHSVHS